MGLTGSGKSAGGDWLAGWPLKREIKALATGRLCREEWRRQCRMENGAFADWACEVCEEFLRPEAISPWTWHLLFLHHLQKAGYPFRANDLSLEIWLLLGLLQRELEAAGGGKIAQNQKQI
ncbi:MAG: hypothetical protein AB1491_04835 [Thermodesulfobacteriota bacterium]